MQVQLQMPKLVLPANDKSGSDDDFASSLNQYCAGVGVGVGIGVGVGVLCKN